MYVYWLLRYYPEGGTITTACLSPENGGRSFANFGFMFFHSSLRQEGGGIEKRGTRRHKNLTEIEFM